MSQLAFGDFVLDVSARTLQHQRAHIMLRRKEFDLLKVLAVAGGAAVSKDAIMAAVWGNAEMTDAALTQCIYRLRQTLARHDPHTEHIATIAGLGYRLVTVKRSSQ